MCFILYLSLVLRVINLVVSSSEALLENHITHLLSLIVIFQCIKALSEGLKGSQISEF